GQALRQYLWHRPAGGIDRPRRRASGHRRSLRSLGRLHRRFCRRDRDERAVRNVDLAGVARKSSRGGRQDGARVERARLTYFLARPASASLIFPLNLTPAVFNRPIRPSMSFVIIMNRFHPPGFGLPPAVPPLPAPGALK